MHGCTFLRRLTAWAMLGLYGLIASGLPLPVAVPPAAGSAAAAKLAGKDRSQPFPCMDKACGCDSAERCFSNCCCHTPAETLAWAKARGIEPAVIAALERRVATARPARQAGGCCAARAARPSCCEAAEVATSSCCETDDLCGRIDDAGSCDPLPPAKGLTDTTRNQEPPEDEPSTRGVVILRAMLACGGIVAQWAAACVSLPPPGSLTCEIPWPRVGTVTMRDEGARGTGGPPDLPPPRG